MVPVDLSKPKSVFAHLWNPGEVSAEKVMVEQMLGVGIGTIAWIEITEDPGIARIARQRMHLCPMGANRVCSR